MIKIIRAEEIIDIELEPPVRTVSVELDIDGHQAFVGGIDPQWSRSQVMQHLESIRKEILDSIPEPSIKPRLDLLDSPPRDIEAELDDIKTRLSKLETKEGR